MSMALGKLETTLSIEFLKEGSASSYSMMVAQVCEGTFELCNANVKLEVLNDGNSGQSTRFMVFGDVKDYLAFMAV